jgi:hypothetical protein
MGVRSADKNVFPIKDFETLKQISVQSTAPLKKHQIKHEGKNTYS